MDRVLVLYVAVLGLISDTLYDSSPNTITLSPEPGVSLECHQYGPKKRKERREGGRMKGRKK